MTTLRACRVPGCTEVSTTGYCAAHEHVRAQVIQQREEQRPRDASRLYGRKWKAARLEFLRTHPLCVHCLAKGITTAATVVDHIQPHKGDLKRFWSRRNWQPLCKPCHDFKTATEDGGWAHSAARVVGYAGGSVDEDGRITIIGSRPP